LKGTEGILRHDIPEAVIIGTADSEAAYRKLMKKELPDLVLLDLGLGGSTTIGVELCRQTKVWKKRTCSRMDDSIIGGCRTGSYPESLART
jgi:DNA-binding NarL/FixJ family response regulator